MRWFWLWLVLLAAPLCAEEKPKEAPNPDADWDPESKMRKSYWIPAAEIVTFQALLNRWNRANYGADYTVSRQTVQRNLHSSWGTDKDPFKINQLGHPYQGSMYHTFARSAGLDYWESSVYTFLGSMAWELAGESTQPSRNDQIASGIGGSFLGEVLFRMSSLWLERSDNLSKFWREAGATVISPATGINRNLFGDRFSAIFNSRNPAYYSRVSLGASGTTQNQTGTSTEGSHSEALVDFSLDYGLPGKPGYHYQRPYDYFAFQISASSGNGLENLLTRGLLFGTDYEWGSNYRGIWGLYGSYDYIAPQTFRVSSTALSLGTTWQWSFSRAMALQGTAMAGLGYAAVGTVRSTTGPDYHYGGAPQALIALRLILGDRASLDVTGREYFVSKIASANNIGGTDNIVRTEVAFTYRIRREHAVSIRYLYNRRDASFNNSPDLTQTRGTIGLFYTLLGHDRFGAVDWH